MENLGARFLPNLRDVMEMANVPPPASQIDSSGTEAMNANLLQRAAESKTGSWVLDKLSKVPFALALVLLRHRTSNDWAHWATQRNINQYA